MFNTKEKINRILGNSSFKNNNMKVNPRKAFNFNGTSLSLNGQYDPNHLMNEVRKLLDKMPEIKEAKGTLNVKFNDGKQQMIKLSYS